MGKKYTGFTLIELLIVVAIVAILAAVAYPSYADYVLRGYLVDATNGMSSIQAQMEQYYQDNRKYDGFPCSNNNTSNFTFTCVPSSSGASATSNDQYTITATGTSQGPAREFTYTYTYTIASGLVKATTALKPSWGSTCDKAWIVKKGQPCS